MSRKVMAAILAHPEVRPLLSDEHFSVDGTLVKAWAAMKSFQPKADEAAPSDTRADPGEPRMQNPELALWRTVLITNLRADDADEWTSTPGFRCVCALALLDADADAVRDAWAAGRVAPATASPKRAKAA